jgi:hypothetical protein
VMSATNEPVSSFRDIPVSISKVGSVQMIGGKGAEPSAEQVYDTTAPSPRP